MSNATECLLCSVSWRIKEPYVILHSKCTFCQNDSLWWNKAHPYYSHSDTSPKTSVFSFPARSRQWRWENRHQIYWGPLQQMASAVCSYHLRCLYSSLVTFFFPPKKRWHGESPEFSAGSVRLQSFAQWDRQDAFSFYFKIKWLLVLPCDTVNMNTGPLGIGPISSSICHILFPWVCALVYPPQKSSDSETFHLWA